MRPEDYRMNRKWIGLRIIISLCAMLGWWGFLYPELVLTPDTVTVSQEDENGELIPLPGQWDLDSNLYLDILNAGKDRITFRSRMFANLNLIWEAFHDRKAD